MSSRLDAHASRAWPTFADMGGGWIWLAEARGGWQWLEKFKSKCLTYLLIDRKGMSRYHGISLGIL